MPTLDPTTGTPPMIGRRLDIPAWLAYVGGYDFGSIPPTRLTLHHTWKPTIAQWRGLASMKSMQQSYAAKNWSAAPHIYCAPDGIWLFTPMHEIGVHAGSLNGSLKQGWYSIGIEMVGDYDRDLPSGAVWSNTLAVLGGLARRLGRSFGQLLTFHRDASAKSCPGHAVQKAWVIAEVTAWLQEHAIPVRAPYTEFSRICALPPAIIPQAVAARIAPNREYTAYDIESIVTHYWETALLAGVDPLVAVAQMCHETGNLGHFWSWRPQRNPAGIGVTGEWSGEQKPGYTYNTERERWELGVSFDSWEFESIPAHIGRLLAYATAPGERTPAQQLLITIALDWRDLPLVMHGSALTLRGLGAAFNPTGKGWAKPGTNYGAKIAAKANALAW